MLVVGCRLWLWGSCQPMHCTPSCLTEPQGMMWGSQGVRPRMVGWEGSDNIIGLQGSTCSLGTASQSHLQLGEGSPSHCEASSHRVVAFGAAILEPKAPGQLGGDIAHSQGSYSGMRGGSRHKPGGQAQGNREVSWTWCGKRDTDGWSPPGSLTTTCRTSTSAHRPACCCWPSSVSLSPWCGVSSVMRTSKCCHIPGPADSHPVGFHCCPWVPPLPSKA